MDNTFLRPIFGYIAIGDIEGIERYLAKLLEKHGVQPVTSIKELKDVLNNKELPPEVRYSQCILYWMRRLDAAKLVPELIELFKRSK